MDLFYMVLLLLLLMAGDVETNPGPYNKDVYKRLAEDLQSLASDYDTFGTYLNVEISEIRRLEKTFKFDAKRILLEIIDHWLSNTEESHRLGCLLNALDKVHRADLSDKIRSKYKEIDFKDTASSEHNDSAVADRSRIESNPEKSDNFINSDAIVPLDFMGVGINDERIKDLELQTIEIHGKFRKVLNTLFDFVKANSSAKENLQWVLHQERPIKGILKSKHDYHDPIDFSSEGGIMRFLSQHCSFFNFELVETAINAIDFEEGKAMLGVYKKSFEVYAQNRVIECPTCLGKTTEGDHCCCYVFLDENFEEYRQVYLKKLQHDISRIFGRNILHIHGVVPGSIAVIFHISASLIDEIFPLSDEKIHLLKNFIYGNSRIQKLICGFYSYTINSTTTVDSQFMASADLEKLEKEFFNYIDRFSIFEKEITAATILPEILYCDMHWHARFGYLELIQGMIRKGFYDPSKINEHGNTALHCAAQSGHLTVVKYYIETLKLDFIQKNSQDRSLLHLATISCNIKLVQYLLAMSCFDLYDKDIFKAVPLHYSCALGSVEITQILIEKMTNSVTLNKMLVRTSIVLSSKAFNPFHIAIGCGQTKIVYFFIKNLNHNCSEDVFSLVLSVKHSHILQFLLHTQNFSSDAKHLALFMAVNAVFVDSIKFLSAVVHYKIPQYVCIENLPLSLAIQQGDLEKVQFLAKTKNINWNEVSIGHRTLLHQACLEGHLHVAKYLVEEQNVQVQVSDKDKCSPLHLACASGNVQLIEYLVSLEKIDPMSEDLYYNKPLHYAAMDGELDAIKFFLDTKKFDPNLKGSIGSTLLHFACLNGYLNIVQYLIETWDCDPLCNNDFSCTPLDKAVLSGHLKIVKYLTKDWSSIPLSTDSNKDNLLQMAIWHDKIEVLRYFLEEKGCDMKDYESEESLLHVSCMLGSLTVTKYLVEVFHMDPKSKNVYGLTSLHYASVCDQLQIVKFLKDFFQPYEEVQSNRSGTPLSLAAFKGYTEIVQFLIENDMYDSDTKMLDNDSYLHVIALSGNFVALKLLLATGKFDVHCQNKYEQTPLMIACMHGHLELARYFIETHHCNPVTADNRKNNSLHYSAHSSLDLVKYLIEELNLDPNTKGYANCEPLHMASDIGKLDIVEYLVLKQRCDPSVRADFSVCPIHYAACVGHLPVLKFLISQGCNPFTTNDGNSTPFHMAALCGKLDIIKHYVDEYGSLRDFQQHYNSAISMARQNQHHEVVSYLDSQLPVASEKDTNPVACTTDEIKKVLPPIMDENVNKQKYKHWNHIYNNLLEEKATKLNYFGTLPCTLNFGLHIFRRFM